MSEENVFTPGLYKGKITACNIKVVGEKETTVVEIEFQVIGVGRVRWNGWFSSKVNEKTKKTYTQLVIQNIAKLGFAGKDIEEMADPKRNIDDLFDTDREWDVDVDWQEDRDGNRTKYKRISRIMFGGDSRSEENKFDVIKKFKGMNLRGELLKAREESKVEPTNRSDSSSFKSDDVPF